MPILECTHCDHGWHATRCPGYVVAGGVAHQCVCPNSAPNVPTPTQYQAGKRNPVADLLRADVTAAKTSPTTPSPAPSAASGC